MPELLVAAIVFLALFGGAMLGIWGAHWLKERHLSKETKDAVQLGVGMIAAMASLILGLMTASVKGNFDATAKDVQQFATYLITLDMELRQYGPQAEPARAILVEVTREALAGTWRLNREALAKITRAPSGATPAPKDGAGPGGLAQTSRPFDTRLSELGQAIRALVPATPNETDLKSVALSHYNSLTVLRWTVIEESVTAVPPIFIGVLVLWLTLIFLSFGLFAPVNRVSVTAFVLCAASLAGAIFIILEMSTPFDGLIYVPPAPMEKALARITG